MEDLMNVEIASTASLTKTKARLVPAAVTTITKDDIQTSGARSLFELLDIYVPNLQWARNYWEADNLGLRGILNDRDDKYLLLVNGRVMNDHTHYGAVSERDLVMLRDIHHIDVVRGPGSALYGPGAVAMVINIITDNAETFQGTEVSTRAGAIEEFQTVEFRHGQKFKDGDGGIYLYAGSGNYTGANGVHAPQITAIDFPSQTGWWDPAWGTLGPFPTDGLQAGDPLLNPEIHGDGASARGVAPIKLHAEITKGNWDIWARYTRGGKEFGSAPGLLLRNPYGWTEAFWDWGQWRWTGFEHNFYGYQQATAYIGYKQEVNEDIEIDYAFSYDLMDFERQLANSITDAYREDEYYGKALLQWQANERNKVALGVEVLHSEYGLRSLDWPHLDARCAQLTPMPRWSTNMYSVLGEWQWTITDRWTTFLGGRIDEHSQTDTMLSPRATVAYAPTDKDTLKLMWSRSVRAPMAEEMQKEYLAGGGDSDTEKLGTVEFRYERRQNQNLDLAATVFWHYDFELISWSGSDSNVIGTQKDYGLELEASYHTDRTRLSLSHAYTKLDDFDLAEGEWTLITAEPYGFGNDLANWSNHVTKLTALHQLDDQWTAHASMRVYWGFPGMEDWTDYEHSRSASYPAEAGWKRTYRGNYYLNLGLQYKPSDVLTVGINGYYLLGIFDEDLNKRSGNTTSYRDHAPALAAYAIYKFR